MPLGGWGDGHLAGHVVEWQARDGRHGLPWQRQRDPYRVWLSEVMLQQTQVSTVVDYYPRFLQRFPDVAALAAAPLDEVLALWSGLGYYRRARMLHTCAQVVVTQHAGLFPSEPEALAALPGIGRSTAAAIAAFCFDQRAAILDGNVKRLLARVLGYGADLAVAAHERALWQAACELLPSRGGDMPAYTQGLMDLGATVCTPRRPDCAVCPLRSGCVAWSTDRIDAYPLKTRKLVRGRRENAWLWLAHGDRVWLQQRAPVGVWAGLWCLPSFDDAAALQAFTREHGLQAEPLPAIDHVLTHFDWRLLPHRVVLAANEPALAPAITAALAEGRWVALHELSAFALPAPLRRLLSEPGPAVR